MPYTIDNPPERIKELPKHAQEIFIAAYNAAIAQYKGDEQKVNQVAWAAVKSKYKQDEDGNWVAKESKEVKMATKIKKPEATIDQLQARHSEIIQEIGMRNASADSARIKKIIDICQELLSSESAAESKITEAIKEADDVLIWLKEQEVVKTEDNVKFPAEAYAYAPDKEKPSEWKLRLWEDLDKKVTRKQLGAAAAALSPGGFRGQKVDIPADDLPAVKRKIRAAYRSLDVPDEEIPRWVKESRTREPLETRELLNDYIPLTEAKLSKGNALITVIKPGFNATKERYYPQEVLARDFNIFEGVKMYADHPTEVDEKIRPERSIRDWVGSLNKVTVNEDGSIIGKATIVEPWMQEKLAILRDKDMLSEIGVSINAVGSASNAEIEGTKTKMVEKLIRARSVDFVTEAGAGGGVNLYESVDPHDDIDLIDLVSFKERRADLVHLIESEIRNEIQKEVRRKMELEEKVIELEGQVATLTTEKEELQTKLTQADKEKAKAKAWATIKEAVGKAELPDAAKERITDKFKDAETADGIEEAIQSEKDYIAKLAEAGKVKGMGPTTPDPTKAKEALRESVKNAHPDWTEQQIETFVQGR